MAKKNFTLKFTNAFISLEDDTITEITRDSNYVHSLSDIIEQLEGKQLDITFSEKTDVIPEGE